jgi:hypothetical protein
VIAYNAAAKIDSLLGIRGLVSSVALEYYLVCVLSNSFLSCHCSWIYLLSCRCEGLPSLVRPVASGHDTGAYLPGGFAMALV